MKKVFVIAMQSEALAVRDALGDDVEIIVSGIGKVNAAAAAQKAIMLGATEILNCGLCGGMDEAMEISDVYEVSSAVEYDFDLAELNGTDVGVLNERKDQYIPARVKGVFPGRIIATGDRFTNSEDDFSLLERLGCTLRDMEAAAIAHVCEKNDIVFRSLKAVSDVKGRGAMVGQYVKHAEDALSALSRAVRKWA